MANHRLSNEAKKDLIRIHHYGVMKFGVVQADKYFKSFFEYFEVISKQPFYFPVVDFMKTEYRRCVCGSDSIYFRINKDTIEIMAIIGRQDLDNIFNK